MAFDKGLAERIREVLKERHDVQERKMFGGLCFMVDNHMCCGIVGEELMLRVGPLQYQKALAKPHAREMDFTGRAMKGMVYVEPDGFENDIGLLSWINLAIRFVTSLPPKVK